MLKNSSYLVIGANSLVGGALIKVLQSRGYKTYGTTRRADQVSKNMLYLVFADVQSFEAPMNTSYSFVVAAATNYKNCEENLEARKTNEEYEQIIQALEEAISTIDKGEYDYEGAMARTQLQTVVRNSQELINMLSMDDNMPEWVQSKITLAQDYISSVRDYLKSREELGEATAYYNKPSFLKKMSLISHCLGRWPNISVVVCRRFL